MNARPPAGNDEMHTTERLARALLARMQPGTAGADAIMDMVTLAREGWYHDFLSTQVNPIGALIEDAQRAGLEDIARRAADGEFDATVAESREFGASEEGQKLWRALVDPDRAKQLGEQDTLWVSSKPTPDWARYLTVVHMGEGWSWELETTHALHYCRVLMDATAAAETWAAVFQQLVARGGGDEARENAKLVVSGLRESVGRFTWNAGAFLLTPGVNDRGEPFLRSQRPEGRWWRWEPADVKQHVQHVQEAASAAWHDMFYRNYLINSIGLDEGTASATVGDLRSFRREQDTLVVPRAPRPAGSRSSKRPRRGRRGNR